VPVVSAVGHETDTVLADFAADVRAKTPTYAAELVVPVAADLVELLAGLRRVLDQRIDAVFAARRQQLAALRDHRALAQPQHRIALQRQQLDEQLAALTAAARARGERAAAELARRRLALAARHPAAQLSADRARFAAARQRLGTAAVRTLERNRAHLATAVGRLEALSPLAVIGRGYSVLRDARGRVVRVRADAPPGSALQARVGDGWLDLTATGGRPQPLNEPGGDYR
jgi:exodeoxyribonuclease VII large subunit